MSAFRDALCLRYGWHPSNLPLECTCGKQFSVEHALSCSHGGFPSIRHNEINGLIFVMGDVAHASNFMCALSRLPTMHSIQIAINTTPKQVYTN